MVFPRPVMILYRATQVHRRLALETDRIRGLTSYANETLLLRVLDKKEIPMLIFFFFFNELCRDVENKPTKYRTRGSSSLYTWLGGSLGVSPLIPVFPASEPTILVPPLIHSDSISQLLFHSQPNFLLLFSPHKWKRPMHRELLIILQPIFWYDNFIHDATFRLLCGSSVQV